MKRLNKWLYNLVQYWVLNKLTAYQCKCLFDERHKQDGRIAITWHIQDVIHMAATNYKVALNDHQAYEILDIAEKRHDANEGINWIVLDVHIEYYISSHKIESDPLLCICSECGAILTSYDAYADENTGEPLCDHCSLTNEATGNYRKAVK